VLEALDHAGWNYAASVLTSLAGICLCQPHEGSNMANPIDLVSILKALCSFGPGCRAPLPADGMSERN
jgi:hypothetical protein